jgi:hypothetical protein
LDLFEDKSGNHFQFKLDSCTDTHNNTDSLIISILRWLSDSAGIRNTFVEVFQWNSNCLRPIFLKLHKILVGAMPDSAFEIFWRNIIANK